MVALAKAGFWIAMTWLVLVVSVVVREAPARIDARLVAAQGAAVGEIAATREALVAESESFKVAAVSAIREQGAMVNNRLAPQILSRVDEAEGRAEVQLDTLNKTIADQAGVLTSQLAGFRADLAPSVKATNEFTAVLFRRDALPAQLLGVMGAAKVALGQTAETMRDVQRATPGFIATWQQIGTHVNVMTDAGAKSFLATQHTMENFAAASKPLPTWARIALGVGPPVAQAGAAAVGAGAALGWLK